MVTTTRIRSTFLKNFELHVIISTFVLSTARLESAVLIIDLSCDVIHAHFKPSHRHVALEPKIFTFLVAALVVVNSVAPCHRDLSKSQTFGKHVSPPSPVARYVTICTENCRCFPVPDKRPIRQVIFIG